MRRAIGIVAAVAILAGIGAGWCLYRGISASIHAEYALHAALLSVQLLEEYVVKHDGAWPRSWADLEGLPPRDRAMFRWPRDSHEVQRYVSVDFSADPQRLARQSSGEFEAVRPIGPYYPFKHYGSVDALLKAIREHNIR
jgi:hypothetical protein